MKDFVYLTEICPGILISADYATTNNFTGSIVPGYHSLTAILAKGPAEALSRVQLEAQKHGLCLKVFDGYRPVKAVQFFLKWSQSTEINLTLKQKYYPDFTRAELFDQGYLAKQSTHSRGCAVDLTLSKQGIDLDMGTCFDFFHEKSNTSSQLITPEQVKNRILLIDLMEMHGFVNYDKEWWHFTYRPEPFPNTYFDFDLTFKPAN